MNDKNYRILEELKAYVDQYDKYTDKRSVNVSGATVQQCMPIILNLQDLAKIQDIVREAAARDNEQHRSYLVDNAQTAARAAMEVLNMVASITGKETSLLNPPTYCWPTPGGWRPGWRSSGRLETRWTPSRRTSWSSWSRR